MQENRTSFYVLIALMIALVAVVTRSFVVPVGVGSGYFNFSDTVVYFVAFLLGPLAGLIAGGLGTALADLSLGFGAFAPLSFLAHGLQGYVAGQVARPGTLRSRVLGAILGTATMVGIYFVGEFFGPGGIWGGPAQAMTEWPSNILQNLVGAVVAIPLVEVVRRAYPPLARYTER